MAFFQNFNSVVLNAFDHFSINPAISPEFCFGNLSHSLLQSVNNSREFFKIIQKRIAFFRDSFMINCGVKNQCKMLSRPLEIPSIIGILSTFWDAPSLFKSLVITFWGTLWNCLESFQDSSRFSEIFFEITLGLVPDFMEFFKSC